MSLSCSTEPWHAGLDRGRWISDDGVRLARPPSAVIVEGDRELRALLTLVVATTGVRTHAAVDGIHGLQLFRQVMPTLVVSDVALERFHERMVGAAPAPALAGGGPTANGRKPEGAGEPTGDGSEGDGAPAANSTVTGGRS